MRKLSHIAIAISLILGGALVAHATEIKKEIEIKAKSGEPITVVVSNNDDVKKRIITKEAMADSALLAKEIADLDKETQQLIIDLVAKSSAGKGEAVVWQTEDNEQVKIISKSMTFTDGDEKVVVIDMDDKHSVSSPNISEGVIRHIVNKSVNNGENAMSELHFSFGDTVDVNTLSELIKNSKLSVEDLNKLQAILDSKR